MIALSTSPHHLGSLPEMDMDHSQCQLTYRVLVVKHFVHITVTVNVCRNPFCHVNIHYIINNIDVLILIHYGDALMSMLIYVVIIYVSIMLLLKIINVCIIVF